VREDSTTDPHAEIPIPGFRRPLEMGRAGRSARYHVEPQPAPGVYVVTGGREPHFVRLEPYPECDCGDSVWTDAICVHLCAVLEFGGNTDVVRLRDDWLRREEERLALRAARKQEREARRAAREAKRKARAEKEAAAESESAR
jgi:hypothetical protein